MFLTSHCNHLIFFGALNHSIFQSFTQLYSFKYSYLIQIIYAQLQVFLSNINYLQTDLWD